MSERYGEWYKDFEKSMDMFGDDELFGALDQLIKTSKNNFAFNRKILEKAIDVSWVEAIENGMLHVDNVIRQPRLTIEDVEEVVPIALSKKITVESVKHLAQHTDLIQSIDKKTGKITPSKILNVHKEESYMTYENKFVNTLIDRLYIFINTRYEKLAQVSKDEEVMSLGFDTVIEDGAGGKMKVELKLETTDSLDTYDDNGYTIWQRVEKLKKTIEGYKGSDFCTHMGSAYIRPPVMRTNAIMKNVDLKACLTLWQYIESYDKVGYEINIANTAIKPGEDYIDDLYKLTALNLLLFRSYNSANEKFAELKTQKYKPVAPKFMKRFEKELADDYGVFAEGIAGYVAADGDFKLQKKLPADVSRVFKQIGEVIDIEKNYLAKKEEERLARLKAEEEAERLRQEEEARLAEQRRIEEARREELERIRREKEEEERRVQEMLAKKKAEQEAEQRERERQEQERLAKLEEQRKREEEERLRREEEERLAAERAKINEDKKKVRAELGEAEGLDKEAIINEKTNEEDDITKVEVTEDEIEQAKEAMEEAAAEGSEQPEFEDPREVAARMKLEQQKKEKERRETERAQRLKAERQYFESKSFREIRWEYSKNPIRLIQRFVIFVMAMVFGVISEDTDDPNYKKRRAMLEERRQEKFREQQARDAMEVYYKKYAKTFKYSFRRKINDYKFKRKREKERKNRPRPVYNPPVRTPEEQHAIDLEMKRLYREYHVSALRKLIRRIEDSRRQSREEDDTSDAA